MTLEKRYESLFKPLKIGPVTAPNRFYQVPHCTGMGHALPQTLAAMRGMKAAGGWGVVCTEYCSIHPTSDDHPYPFAAFWDESDVAHNAAMADAVHAHGALAGVELWHGGSSVANLASREVSIGVRSMAGRAEAVQCRAMDLADIRELRRWHRQAALRAKRAGFDIIYVYPTHGYLVSEFLSRAQNDRRDDYGGTLRNRSRLMRELLEETKEAVGDSCAVAVRFSANGHGDAHLTAEEAREVMHDMKDLADLWDLVVDDYYGLEMATSRFVKEAALDEHIAGLRALLGKPVVTVGRLTSPDTMAARIRQGLVDFIGAARPSIADPFLPNKIRDGRTDDIRECIGCNICYAHNSRGSALRCTQNPTMGDEWRRGWHPEEVPPGKDETVLIVGAGPAGLEAAQVLGKRGYQVTLAEQGDKAGGRVNHESRLKGLGEWARVRDYRLGQIAKLPNVALHLGSAMTAQDVKDFGAQHVLLATGATWRRNGLGRSHATALQGLPEAAVFTPDDIYQGRRPQGPLVIFDDDNFYLGAVLASQLASEGHQVTYVTAQGRVAEWSQFTGEQYLSHGQLLDAGVTVIVNQIVSGFDGDNVTLSCAYSNRTSSICAKGLLLLTSREPNETLYRELLADESYKPMTLRRIGDCEQPALIAHAVYAGHRVARELGLASVEPPKRDRLLAP